jgi:predicted esterase
MTADLEALFSSPTRLELASVEIDWAIRNPLGVDLKTEAERELPDGKRLLVVSHFVDWRRHYAAVRLPAGDGSFPILMLNHNGTDGVDITEIAAADEFLGDGALRDGCIVLLASFRGEKLRAGEMGVFQSRGDSGEMDRDADDAIGLLDAVIRGFPQADAGRAAALGFSRGAHVALHSAMREPRLRGVVDFFCATDFFHPEVKTQVLAAARGQRVRNPIITAVMRDVVKPLEAGDYRLEEARTHLLRISPAYFAARLPRVQLHHGGKDPIISPAHSQRVVDTLSEAGREDFTHYLYADGVHRQESLPGSGARAAAFLREVLGI